MIYVFVVLGLFWFIYIYMTIKVVVKINYCGITL